MDNRMAIAEFGGIQRLVRIPLHLSSERGVANQRYELVTALSQDASQGRANQS